MNSPLFAEGQGGFAHPLALLLFGLLPAAAASNLFLLLHLYAGLIFTYLLCRDLGQSRLAATLAAPAFALSAFFLARLGIYTIITNGVWLPGLLWLAVRFVKTKDVRYALAGGFGGALALLAGQFQLATYAVVAASAYAFIFARPRKNALLALLFFGVLPLLLAAVQLLPTYELWRLSDRALDTRSAEYSLWPPQFLQLLLPDLFGRSPHPAFAPVAEPRITTYWGRSSFVESAFYVGIFPFVLAVVGFARRRRWFFLGMTILAAAFACGTYTPLYQIYKYLPPFSLFRAPARLLIFVTFTFAVAAGDGLDYFVRTRSRAFAATALATTLAAAAVILTFRFTLPQFRAAVERVAEAKAEEAAVRYDNAEAVREYYAAKAKSVARRAATAARLRNPATWFQFALLGTAIVVFGASRRNRALAAAAPFLIILLTTADLYRYGRGLNPTVRASFVNRPPPVTAAFDSPAEGRVYSNGFSLGPDTELGLGLLHENTPALWGYDLLVARASLRPAYATAVFERLEALYTTGTDPGGGRFPTPTAPALKLFRAYGIRYFVRLNPWLGADIPPPVRIPPYFVYEDPKTAPRARSLTSYRLASDDREALKTMSADDFDPSREAVLKERPEALEFPVKTPAVKIERVSPNTVSCVTSGPSMLLLDELHYPGWKAEIDGQPARILRANVISRLVAVPSGRHTVTFRYRPITFFAGLAISIASWLSTLIILVVLTLRRRKRNRDTAI